MGQQGPSHNETGAERPLVSVLIPAYNAAATLAVTLSSVEKQTYPNIEIIVVDDGSTDATADILRHLAERMGRLRFVSIPNGGQAAARNLALSRAEGKYAAPLDSDDIWHPNYLERLVSSLEQAGPAAAMAYAFLRRIDSQGRVTETKPGYAVAPVALNQMLAFNVVGTGSAIVFRTDLARSVGGYETRLGGAEDYLMQLRLAARGTVIAVPEYLVGYRTSNHSLSTKRMAMSGWSKRVLEIARVELAEADPRVFASAVARSHADAAVHAARSGRHLNAAQDMLTALNSDFVTALRTLGRKARAARTRANSSPTTVQFVDMDPHDAAGAPTFNTPALAYARRADTRTVLPTETLAATKLADVRDR